MVLRDDSTQHLHHWGKEGNMRIRSIGRHGGERAALTGEGNSTAVAALNLVWRVALRWPVQTRCHQGGVGLQFECWSGGRGAWSCA
jgi:hypothetical protein